VHYAEKTQLLNIIISYLGGYKLQVKEILNDVVLDVIDVDFY